LLTLLSGLLLVATAGAARAGEPLSYDTHIKPFVARYCVECHNAKRARAGVNLESYQAMMKTSKRKSVIPGKPDDSLFLMTLEGKSVEMPPRKSRQPTPEEVTMVRDWIEAGAKEAAGTKGELVPRDGQALRTWLAALTTRRRSFVPQGKLQLARLTSAGRAAGLPGARPEWAARVDTARWNGRSGSPAQADAAETVGQACPARSADGSCIRSGVGLG
jgi:hypothetical protein